MPKSVTSGAYRVLPEQERRSVQQTLDWILRHGMSQKDLGELLCVHQSTISRWIREGVPEKFDEFEFKPIPSLLSQVKDGWLEHMAREAILPNPPPYLCSKAESYPEQRKTVADEHLRRRVQPPKEDFDERQDSLPAGFREFSVTTHQVRRGDEVQSCLLTKIVLPSDLPEGVDAYCYLDDSAAPSLFVVLVSCRLTFSKQQELAKAEVDAHLVPHLAAPVELPRAPRLFGRRLP